MTASSAAAEQQVVEAKTIDDILHGDYLLDLTLDQYLVLLLKQKGLRCADVIRNSGMDKAYVHQIFRGEKKPSRDKLIAIAFGLHLSAEETQRMLKLGECSELYARRVRDAIILFAIQRGIDIWKTDDFLADNGLSTILDAGK